MCYHNSLTKTAIELENRYNAHMEPNQVFEPIYHASAFSHPAWPVITADKPGLLQMYTWGLIPHWTKSIEEGLKFRTNTLNAQSETVFEKPSFKYSIKQKRCLVPSTGFYEWMDFNKKKYPHFITVKEHDVFSMAGIYQQYTDKATGEVLNTFSILTTKANPMMERIHNLKKRMPVILQPEREMEWIEPELSEDQYKNIFLPFNENNMDSRTISKLITSRTENSNVPDVQSEFIYDELGLC